MAASLSKRDVERGALVGACGWGIGFAGVILLSRIGDWGGPPVTQPGTALEAFALAVTHYHSLLLGPWPAVLLPTAVGGYLLADFERGGVKEGMLAAIGFTAVALVSMLVATLILSPATVQEGLNGAIAALLLAPIAGAIGGGVQVLHRGSPPEDRSPNRSRRNRTTGERPAHRNDEEERVPVTSRDR